MILLLLGVLVVAAGFALAGLVVLGVLGTDWGEAAVRAQLAVGFVLGGVVVGGVLAGIGQWLLASREKRPPGHA